MSLITASALAARLGAVDLKILDARFVLNDADAGRNQFLEAHIPGAMYVDLNTDLSGPKTDALLGRHPLPSESAFSATLQGLGIGPEHDVMVYDQLDGAMAASRCWFLLQLVGHEKCTVLDGGFNAWLAAGLPVSAAVPEPEASVYPVHFNQALLVQTSELKTELADSVTCTVLDARAPERFRGDVEPLDTKAGHIPGALNRPYSENMHNGFFKSAEQLRVEFTPFLSGQRRLVLSCGSGVTACHNALALSHAGIGNYRLYAPSWSGWIADEGNPVALGP